MKYFFFSLSLFVSFTFFAQNPYWEKLPSGLKARKATDKRMPDKFDAYKLNLKEIKRVLKKAPLRTGKKPAATVLLPGENQKLYSYKIYQSGTLSRELREAYPELVTYRIFSADGKEQGSLLLTGWGIYAEIFRTGKQALIIQPSDIRQSTYMIYNKKALKSGGFECLVEDAVQKEEYSLKNASPQAKIADDILKRYRFAIATTGEYSQYHIQLAINDGIIDDTATDDEKKQVVLAAVTAAVDRLNTIYERDLSIQLSLVPNETNVIFLDPDTDPYNNDDLVSMVEKNTSVLNNYIGTDNYDGGHLFTTNNGGGLSYVGIICNDDYKGGSATGSANPIGDPYVVDFVAHEVGHSFNANHTFANKCGGQRNLATSIEPGSGSTIMAYAGVCAPNVQVFSDDYFHSISLKEIGNYVAWYGRCYEEINIGNTAPVVSVTDYSNKYIPKSTPFMLTASATDNEGDFLTYCWEETDPLTDDSIDSYTPDANNATGPMFRSYWGTSRQSRYFPSIKNILDNTYANDWEVLPAVSRYLNFDVTVRDNHPGGGQSPYKSISLQVDDTVGPFRVTSQGDDETWLPGETKTVTWDVAGTTGGDVACSTVDILLSTDFGKTFFYVLAENVPNDGSQTITVPDDVVATSAYLMVKGHNRYFFDLAKGKISLGNFELECSNFSTSPALSIPDNDENGIESTLEIDEDFQIEDVNVSVDISHTYIQDLRVTLISPQGTTVILYDRNCNSQDNIVATFDDQGNELTCDNLTGHVIPVDYLSDVGGENAKGTWTLRIVDLATADTGTLNSWGLEICSLKNLSSVENTVLNALKIWPNPARNNVNISFDNEGINQPVEINLFDIGGRMIFTGKYTNPGSKFTTSISTGTLSKGIYLIKITNGTHTTTQKLLIE